MRTPGIYAKTWLATGLGLTSGWILACSSSPPAPTSGIERLAPFDAPGSDAGTPVRKDVPTQTGGGPTNGAPAEPTTNRDACVAACEAKHPKGVAKARAIDACWAESCEACGQTTAGKPLHGPDDGACEYDVATPSSECSQCTVESCCDAWDACFGDDDCSTLNACVVACAN